MKWWLAGHEDTNVESVEICDNDNPDSKVHGAKMGSTWGRQDPGGPHVSHVNLAIWEADDNIYYITDEIALFLKVSDL